MHVERRACFYVNDGLWIATAFLENYVETSIKCLLTFAAITSQLGLSPTEIKASDTRYLM